MLRFAGKPVKGKFRELKDEYNLDSFVKINKDQINIVVASSDHSNEIANNIIRTAQSLFKDHKYITVKFQN